MSFVPQDLLAHRVHKFGGSSLADATRIGALPALLEPDRAHPRWVVVSAMQGTTDALVALGERAATGGDWHPGWEALRDRHHAAARALGLGNATTLALDA